MVMKMRIIYKNTFDNTLTEKYDKNVPSEDQFLQIKKLQLLQTE